MPNNDVKIDHEAAKRYAAYIGDMARDHVCGQDDVNLSAAYLDAMARLDEAEKLRDVAYGLLDECKARLDKATELLRELIDGLVPCNEPVEPGSVVARVDAFLERKTDDKQS